MKASELFRSWLQRRAGSEEDWQINLRKELIEQYESGVSRKEIVERLAHQMYADDLRDLGAVADLGFFTWQLYLGAAQFLVNYTLPEEEARSGQPGPNMVREKDRRIA